jgi:endonuclease YncB( thermonuclease family)
VLPALPVAPVATAEVVAVPTGDTVILADGQWLRLAGIEAPKRVEGRTGVETRPGAAAARAALSDLALGRALALAPAGAPADAAAGGASHAAGLGALPTDRWGRVVAQAVRAGDGVWLQAALVADGRARVRGHAGARAGLAALLALEAEARAARRGVWAEPFYAVRRPIETPGYVDTFQIVEGRVVEAAEARSGRIYLNFGDNWREDFTATIEPADRPLFDAAGLDPLALAGRTIRLRGWIYAFNGPMITLTHPEQVEVVE